MTSGGDRNPVAQPAAIPVPESYKVAYKGGLPGLPKAKIGAIKLEVYTDRLRLVPTGSSKGFWTELEIPYVAIQGLEVGDRSESTADVLVGGSRSIPLKQRDGVYIKYTGLDGDVTLHLEMSGFATVKGRLRECLEFEDQLRRLHAREQFAVVPVRLGLASEVKQFVGVDADTSRVPVAEASPGERSLMPDSEWMPFLKYDKPLVAKGEGYIPMKQIKAVQAAVKAAQDAKAAEAAQVDQPTTLPDLYNETAEISANPIRALPPDSIQAATTALPTMLQDRQTAFTSDVLFDVRQKRQDILTQLAVCVQEYLALEMAQKDNAGTSALTDSEWAALRRPAGIYPSTRQPLVHDASVLVMRAPEPSLLIEKLPGRIERELARTLSPSETVLVKLRGSDKEALVCTSVRVIILKGGWMTSQMLGTNVFQVPYANVAGAEIKKHLLTGWFELNAGGMQNTPKKFWDWETGSKSNPHQAPNCVALNGSQVQRFREACLVIMTKVAEAHSGVHAVTTASGGLADELNKLASLRASGLLSEGEFVAATRKLSHQIESGWLAEGRWVRMWERA